MLSSGNLLSWSLLDIEGLNSNNSLILIDQTSRFSRKLFGTRLCCPVPVFEILLDDAHCGLYFSKNDKVIK